MELTRRAVMAGAVGPVAAPAPGAARRALPDKASFPIQGVYLDAAFVHPFVRAGYAAASGYLASRLGDPHAVGPAHNARDAAVGRFAHLINAAPQDVAVVPSTLTGENLLVAALGIGADTGVVTDALHYDASLALYGELRRRGTPVAVVRPRGGRIDLADVRAALTSQTRLVAVSLVSSTTGFTYDLAALCEVAHRSGALVYADIIQAAGAMPIDVKASGVDFCCCGTYKWLMGDFGVAFLYVRPDRLDRLTRTQVGWRQLRTYVSHVLPGEPPGDPLGDYTLKSGAAGLFEVGSPAYGALATAVGALDYITGASGLGVERIAAYRLPLLDRMNDVLPAHGFLPLTAKDAAGPIVAFALPDARRRLESRLMAEDIRISLYDNRIRVAPSVYNDMGDIDRLIDALAAGARA